MSCQSRALHSIQRCLRTWPQRTTSPRLSSSLTFTLTRLLITDEVFALCLFALVVKRVFFLALLVFLVCVQDFFISPAPAHAVWLLQQQGWLCTCTCILNRILTPSSTASIGSVSCIYLCIIFKWEQTKAVKHCQRLLFHRFHNAFTACFCSCFITAWHWVLDITKEWLYYQATCLKCSEWTEWILAYHNPYDL